MTSEGDTTLLKNNESADLKKKKKPLKTSKGAGELWFRDVCCSGQRRKTKAFSQMPAVRTCFISGPSTEAKKPHPLTPFSFKILHSPVCLVEKPSIRDFLYLFKERRGKTETQPPLLEKQHPPTALQETKTGVWYYCLRLHFIFFKLRFILKEKKKKTAESNSLSLNSFWFYIKAKWLKFLLEEGDVAIYKNPEKHKHKHFSHQF